jgi:hypothetical protein
MSIAVEKARHTVSNEKEKHSISCAYLRIKGVLHTCAARHTQLCRVTMIYGGIRTCSTVCVKVTVTATPPIRVVQLS